MIADIDDKQSWFASPKSVEARERRESFAFFDDEYLSADLVGELSGALQFGETEQFDCSCGEVLKGHFFDIRLLGKQAGLNVTREHESLSASCLTLGLLVVGVAGHEAFEGAKLSDPEVGGYFAPDFERLKIDDLLDQTNGELNFDAIGKEGNSLANGEIVKADVLQNDLESAALSAFDGRIFSCLWSAFPEQLELDNLI